MSRSSPIDYRVVGGTNLDLDDDEVVEVATPFSVRFGGGRFSTMYVGSNGTVSFT